MATFDLVVTRDERVAVSAALGDVLVGQMGATAEQLQTLLNEGRVRLHLSVDFAYASFCARALGGVGAVVQLVQAETPAPGTTARVDEPERAQPSATAAAAPDGASAIAPPALSSSGRAPSLPIALHFDGLDPESSFVPPERPPSAAAAPFEEPRPANSSRFGAPDASASDTLELESLPSRAGVEEARPSETPPPVALPRTTEPRLPRMSAATNTRSLRPVPARPRPGLAAASLRARPAWAARLRERPPLHAAVGLAVALAVGWVVQGPYSRRAEQRVQAMRVEADGLRNRSDPETQARVAVLDVQGDEAARAAGLHVAALWLVVAGIAFAAWFALT